MSGYLIDLTNKRFSNLVVIERAKDQNLSRNHTYWLCKCGCGNTTVVASEHLRNGRIKSCGCWRKTKLVTHGKTKTKLYKVWRGIVDRTSLKSSRSYKNYGALGIKMCEDWRNNFESFHSWAMASGYKQGLSIDRIDPKGNYEPENCRWTDMKTQQNNRTNNHLITYKGETHTMKQWSEILGIKYSTLSMRLNNYGWPIERALHAL